MDFREDEDFKPSKIPEGVQFATHPVRNTVIREIVSFLKTNGDSFNSEFKASNIKDNSESLDPKMNDDLIKDELETLVNDGLLGAVGVDAYKVTCTFVDLLREKSNSNKKVEDSGGIGHDIRRRIFALIGR